MDEVTARELQAYLRALHKQFRDGVPPVEGISRSAVRVLGVVARAEGGQGVQPGRIADELGMTTSNVAAALGELESAGYVSRQRSSEDARRITVSLTDRGVSTVATHRSLRVDDLQQTIGAALSAAEQAQLAAVVPLLGKLVTLGGARAES